ncbi:unnamed protein product, partial [Polarella glacialis]
VSLSRALDGLGLHAGVEFGLERWGFARLCEAHHATIDAPPEGQFFSSEAAVPGPRPMVVTQPGPGTGRQGPCARPDDGDAAGQSSDEERNSLLSRHITAVNLAAVLNAPKLPEDHPQLQMVLGHLRHLALQLREGGAGGRKPAPAAAVDSRSVHFLKQEVEARAANILVLKGRLGVLESSLPPAWSPPAALWEELVGEPPPPEASKEELSAIARRRLAEIRSEAVRLAEDVALRAAAAKASADDRLRQAAWKEAEADALQAEAELLRRDLEAQDLRLKELRAEERRSSFRATRKDEVHASEATRRADAMAVQHHVLKVQRIWRARQELAQRKLRA